jgi:hypothetical protein
VRSARSPALLTPAAGPGGPYAVYHNGCVVQLVCLLCVVGVRKTLNGFVETAADSSVTKRYVAPDAEAMYSHIDRSHKTSFSYSHAAARAFLSYIEERVGGALQRFGPTSKACKPLVPLVAAGQPPELELHTFPALRCSVTDCEHVQSLALVDRQRAFKRHLAQAHAQLQDKDQLSCLRPSLLHCHAQRSTTALVWVRGLPP